MNLMLVWISEWTWIKQDIVQTETGLNLKSTIWLAFLLYKLFHFFSCFSGKRSKLWQLYSYIWQYIWSSWIVNSRILKCLLFLRTEDILKSLNLLSNLIKCIVKYNCIVARVLIFSQRSRKRSGTVYTKEKLIKL